MGNPRQRSTPSLTRGWALIAFAGLTTAGNAFSAAPTTNPPVAQRPGRPPAVRSTPAPPADRVEIRLAPVPGPQGPVRPTEFILHLANDRGVQELKSENGAVRVLPGDYWLTGWSVTIPDAQGHRWTARGGILGTPPLSTHVAARRGRPVEIRLGTPLATAVVPTIKGRTANFVMTFVGTLGDRCYQVSLDDGKPPLGRSPW